MDYKALAKEIIRQLGGNKFIAMTGAKNFGYLKNSLSFTIPRAKNGIRFIRITLNSMDLYDVEFIKARGNNIATVASIKDVYNQDLKEVVSRETGLCLSL